MFKLLPFPPLTLAKLFGVPQDEVAFRLRLSSDYLRRLAQDPRYARRVLVAELETIALQLQAQEDDMKTIEDIKQELRKEAREERKRD
jgi:hypothetical protein